MAKEKLYDVPGLHWFGVPVPASIAADATLRSAIWVAPCAGKIESIKQQFQSNYTGQTTSYETLAFQNGGAAGDATTAISSLAYSATTVKSGTSPANSVVDMSPTTPVAFAEGDVLIFLRTKTSNGQIVPASYCQIGFRPT